MHHIAYITEDIESAIGDLKEKGFRFLTDSWYTGAEDYRVIFIDQGILQEEAPPAEFFTNPKNPRLKDFLNKVL